MQEIVSRFTLNPRQIRLLLKFLFVALALLGIVVALLPGGGQGFPHADKLLHAGALFGFALLLDLSTTRSFWRWQVPILLCYGGLIEIVQGFTTWRSASWADFAADAAGILLYWVVWRLALRRIVPHDNG